MLGNERGAMDDERRRVRRGRRLEASRLERVIRSGRFGKPQRPGPHLRPVLHPREQARQDGKRGDDDAAPRLERRRPGDTFVVPGHIAAFLIDDGVVDAQDARDAGAESIEQMGLYL